MQIHISINTNKKADIRFIYWILQLYLGYLRTSASSNFTRIHKNRQSNYYYIRNQLFPLLSKKKSCVEFGTLSIQGREMIHLDGKDRLIRNEFQLRYSRLFLDRHRCNDFKGEAITDSATSIDPNDRFSGASMISSLFGAVLCNVPIPQTVKRGRLPVSRSRDRKNFYLRSTLAWLAYQLNDPSIA